MSEQPKKEKRGQLFVVSAPSGAGKTSLVRALMERSDTIGVAISHTTRAKRPEEQDGINYHFVPEVKFTAMVDNGEFLESATVFEHLYGTSSSAANLILQQGKHLILEIDWQGAAQVRQKLKRMSAAFEELSHWHEFDYLLVNDQFDRALSELQAVVAGEGAGHHRNKQRKALGPLIKDLLPQ
jgi:guanylate kinase